MTYYEDLNVDKNASQDEIKKAFRKLAMQHHPDKGGDTETFQKINQAYETLSDERKKFEYDERLKMPQGMPFNPFGGNPFGGGSPFGGGFPFDLNNLFSQMNINFNRNPVRLPDEKMNIELTIKQALEGFDKHLKKTTTHLCSKCTNRCEDCKGQGYIFMPFGNGMIKTAKQMMCTKCQTKGLVFTKSNGCSCKDGKVQKINDIHVKGSRFLSTHNIFKFQQLGAQPQSFLETPSDFYVTLEVKLPSNMTIDPASGTLIYTEKVALYDLICGKDLTLSQLSSEELTVLGLEQSVKIEPLSLSPDFKIVFEGKGLYQSEKTRSNFEVRFNVDYQIEKSKVDVNMLKQAFVPPQPSFD